MGRVMKSLWWAFLIPIALASVTFLVPTTNWFWISALILTTLYLLFWYIQFAGLTQMEQAKMLFEKLAYEINSQQVLIKLSSKQGMPIKWDQVKKAYSRKDDFLIVINRVQMIHLPHRIFNNQNDIKFVESVMKRKGFVK